MRFARGFVSGAVVFAIVSAGTAFAQGPRGGMGGIVMLAGAPPIQKELGLEPAAGEEIRGLLAEYGQAMMQEMQRMYGQGQGQMPGQQFGQAPNNRDPLGRSMYNQGGADLWGERVPTELDLGRARAILDELYRRAGQRNRPSQELDYLNRLLQRF